MSDLCRKCGERERAGKHAWCRECQAAVRKARRVSNVSNEVSNEVSNASNVSNGEQAAQPGKLARAHDHAACHRELEMLRLDVERLKGELAQARMESSTVKVVRVEAPLRPEPAGVIGPVRATGRATPQRPECAGPGRCARLRCPHPGWWTG